EFITHGGPTVTRRQAEGIARTAGVELPDGWDYTEQSGVADQAAALRHALGWRYSEVVTLYGAAKFAGGAPRPTRVDSIDAPWQLMVPLPAKGKRVLYFYAPCAQRFRMPRASVE